MRSPVNFRRPSVSVWWLLGLIRLPGRPMWWVVPAAAIVVWCMWTLR